jgi:hypothetical protein
MAAACSAMVIITAVGVPYAAAAPAAPKKPPPDYGVGDEITVPGTNGSDVTPVASGSAAPPDCAWERVPDQALFAIGHQIASSPRPSPEAYPLVYMCNGRWVGGEANFQWATPAPVEPTMTPEQLAQIVRVRLEGTLPPPQVTSDPAVGEPAIISFPTFVQVSNWTGTVTGRECDPSGLLCVGVTATPALAFSPGEPGAPTIACAGAGSRFVEGASTSADQAAAPGACAYAYQLRTGTSTRPAAWPGTATVAWSLAWQSTSGTAGVLPDVVKAADVARQVNEVQTVIEQ